MFDQIQLKWFEDLTQIDGVAGHEKQVAAYMKSEMEALGYEVVTDRLGSVVAHKPSKVKDAKRVLILGHMDEVGFLVKDITKTGVLKIQAVGGWFSQVLLASRVRVTTRSGKVYEGTIGAIPPHMLTPEKRKAPMQIDDMIVDVGARDREDALAMGIQVGDMVVLKGEFEALANDRYLAKAFDNRYGCVMALDLLRSLKDVDLPIDLMIGASVQEEVGLRGAQTITQMVKPDYAIVLDCSPANDAVDEEALGRLGEGVLIRVVDGNFIANKKFLYDFVDTCKAHDIKHQYYLSLGGTDAGIVHKSNGGVETLTACIVARNIHTNSSILDANDYVAAKKAIVTLLKTRDWA